MYDEAASIDLYKLIDRKSFMLGMITAFAECVAGECKRCALSPPFYPGDRAVLQPEAEKIAEEQGIALWLEENPDIAPEKRVNWWVLYKFPEVLEEYRSIRAQGKNPAREFVEFGPLLSYGAAWGENAERVVPRMRRADSFPGTVPRVLFRRGDWPIPDDCFR